LPALRIAREKARQSVCAGNLKQIGSAIMLYTSDYEEWMPITYGPDVYTATLPFWRQTWVSRTHAYLNSKDITSSYISEVFSCGSGQDDVVEKNGKGGNYLYSAHLGLYTATTYPANDGFGPRRLSKCLYPSDSATTIDGKCKSAGGGILWFDFHDQATAVTYVATRHSSGINVLYADTHVSWEIPTRRPATEINKTYKWNSLLNWPR